MLKKIHISQEDEVQIFEEHNRNSRSQLIDHKKQVEKILIHTLKKFDSRSITYLACIDPITGFPVVEKSKANLHGEDKSSSTILSALAAGVMQTGEYVSKTMELADEHFLEVIIRGSTGHSVFVRLQPIFTLSQGIVLVAMSNNNNTIAQTTRLLRSIGNSLLASFNKL